MGTSEESSKPKPELKVETGKKVPTKVVDLKAPPKAPEAPKHYKIDTDKIKSIEDIKVIFKHLNMIFTPANMEMYNEMEYLLVPFKPE